MPPVFFTGRNFSIMSLQEIAKQIANGLVSTGIEGGTDAVSCSTAGDYPSLGCSQWEGGRADILLSYIDGGGKFIGRSYSDIEESDEIDELKELLSSPQGEEAQMMILEGDVGTYVEELTSIEGFNDEKCIIFAGMWCPTSLYCVSRFIEKLAEEGYDINDLDTIYEKFKDEYAYDVCCDEYAEGYAHRADVTYDYVASI